MLNTQLCCIGWDEIELDWIGLDWIKLDWIGYVPAYILLISAIYVSHIIVSFFILLNFFLNISCMFSFLFHFTYFTSYLSYFIFSFSIVYFSFCVFYFPYPRASSFVSNTFNFIFRFEDNASLRRVLPSTYEEAVILVRSSFCFDTIMNFSFMMKMKLPNA